MRKFLVWGAGNRGKDVINALGSERISAVIDSDSDKYGGEVWGIPIVSLDYALDFYPDNVIIITPEGYEITIAHTLYEKGFFSFLFYGSDFVAVETYMRQINKKDFFSKYDKNSKHYIYGLTLLGVLVYEDFIARGFQCEMILQQNIDMNIVDALVSYLNIHVSSGPCRGFIHRTIDDGIIDFCEDCDSILNLCDENFFENPLLKKFKDIYQDKRCFIVGTGPSLRMSDLDTLHKNQEISIGMNGVYKAFDFTDWRPDYYMVADLDAVRFGKQNIIDMDVKTKFVADIAWDFDGYPGFYKWHLDKRWDLNKRPRFSDDFSKRTYAGLTITYDGALQLATYMGVKEIYLLGIDCSNYSTKKTSHFFDSLGKENTKETGFLQVEANILAYESARDFAEEKGIKIYNATRGGKLEVFERRNFDLLF